MEQLSQSASCMRSFLKRAELGFSNSSRLMISMETSSCSGLMLNLYILFLLPIMPRYSSDSSLSVLIFPTNEQISRKKEIPFSSCGCLLLNSVIDIDLLRCLDCGDFKFSSLDPDLD
jgi:hypothetical protein